MLDLDISSSAVKLMELSRSAAGNKIGTYGVVSLPPQTVVEKNIIDINTLAKAIDWIIMLSGDTDTDTAVIDSFSYSPDEIQLGEPASGDDLVAI